jgi:hypothetical protein
MVTRLGVPETMLAVTSNRSNISVVGKEVRRKEIIRKTKK